MKKNSIVKGINGQPSRHIFCTLALIILWTMGYAQSEEIRSYNKARVYMQDHRVISAKNLKIQGDRATFRDKKKGENLDISMDGITSVRVPKGSYLGVGALMGAGTMGLTAIIIAVRPDPLGVYDDLGTGFYLGLTAGGAALGALIGAAIPKWKQIYSRGKFMGKNTSVNLGISSGYNHVGIKITIPI